MCEQRGPFLEPRAKALAAPTPIFEGIALAGYIYKYIFYGLRLGYPRKSCEQSSEDNLGSKTQVSTKLLWQG